MIDRAELAARIGRLKQGLETGVRVVSAPSLFPTPPEVADEVVLLAGIEPHHRVLEPSSGTGALVDAVRRRVPTATIECVELNHDMAFNIGARQADFLELTPDDLGKFDRVVMNPPFDKWADIRHIRHALGFLNPDGRLVAICADGPRQDDAFSSFMVRRLPAGTFAGTNVRSCILSIDAAPFLREKR